jgi:hypothetical protein
LIRRGRKENVKILNLSSHPLSKSAKKELKEKYGSNYKLIEHPIHIEFEENISKQINEVISDLMPFLLEPDTAIVLPAMSFLAVMLAITISGTIGRYPFLIVLVRRKNEFVIKDIVDLNSLRDNSRRMRVAYLQTRPSTGNEKILGKDED